MPKKRRTNPKYRDDSNLDAELGCVFDQVFPHFLKQRKLLRKGMDHEDMIDMIFNGEHEETCQFALYLIKQLNEFVCGRATVVDETRKEIRL